MPRRTRSDRWRRLEAFAQARRDDETRQLAGQLHRLWRQFEAATGLDDLSPYSDPRLASGSRDSA